MARYEYRCPTCAERFEVERPITAPAGAVPCPAGSHEEFEEFGNRLLLVHRFQWNLHRVSAEERCEIHGGAFEAGMAPRGQLVDYTPMPTVCQRAVYAPGRGVAGAPAVAVHSARPEGAPMVGPDLLPQRRSVAPARILWVRALSWAFYCNVP